MPPISIMIKPASERCNLRCKYCFYKSLASERDVPDYGIMSRKTAERVIDSALSYADGDSVYFTFQGGEPLLAGKEFFKNFVNTVKIKNIKNSDIYYAVQTNGSLIDSEWTDFFKKESILIGVSLDGDKENNSFRIDISGCPAFEKIRAGVELLKASGVDFNILSVVTGRTSERIEEIYKYFTQDCSYKYLQFIPCIRPFGDKSESELYMTSAQYAEFLIKLFKLYVQDQLDGKYTSVRSLDNMVRLYMGQRCEQCGMEGHCSRQFVVEANGNVYPCDFYCVDQWLLGNIAQDEFYDIARSRKAIDFLRESLKLDDKCRTCEYYDLCRGGGCKRTKSDEDHCSAYKRFFAECLPLFKVFVK